MKGESDGKYCLFPKQKLIDAFGEGTGTKEELNAVLDGLVSSGYIDEKYSDDEVVLLKPLGKSFAALEEEKAEIPETTEKDGLNNFWRYFIAFLGAFSGALVGATIMLLLC